MKRIIFLFLILIGVLTIVGWRFYQNNLTGIGPALRKPIQDITQSIPSGNTPAINETEFPLTIPKGFRLSVFAKNLTSPRVLATDSTGVLLTSTPSNGSIVALPDSNSDGIADETITVVDGLNRPHGIAFRCQGICELYVAENNQVSVFDYNSQTKKATNKRKILDLPAGGGHWTRTILFHQNKLYTSIGSSCNVCNETDNRRAKIFVSDIDGSKFTEFANGLRNSVFMAVHPQTSEIWATEMGRDLLGDNTPPEEVNIIKQNNNYGWPLCYDDNIHDTNFDKNTYVKNPCEPPLHIGPHIKMQAHSAPLGLAFVPNSWPSEYADDLLIAYHGSWNRSIPTGYKIVRMKLDKSGQFEGEEDFISGWLQNNNSLGRPVDILFKGESAYISDDKAGVIYELKPSK